MYRVAQIFAGIAGAVHVLFFLMESVFWMNPGIYSSFLVQNLEDAELLRLYIKNQGFYNLFLALGTFTGLFLLKRKPEVANALIIYSCLFMIGAAIVLYFTIPDMISGVFIQGGPPLISLVLLFYALRSEVKMGNHK
ncbi:MAG: DUF1304 domain-containing protein [Acidiferrobacterales bacterium]|nr:DUF1304 domain-containing protein [Acidiferrobacterales bacterium]